MLKKTATKGVRMISGKDPFEFGAVLGKATGRAIREIRALAKARSAYQKIKDTLLLDERITFLQDFYPSLMEEIRGISCGAAVELELLIALNFFENHIWKETEHCSLIFKKETGQVLIGWNEDGSAVYLNRMSLVQAKTPEVEFVTLNYPGLLCGDTLTITSHGLVFALQSLNLTMDDPFGQVGLPSGLAGRLFLSCRSLGEVLELAQHLAWEQILVQGFHLFVYDRKKDEGLTIEFYPRRRQPWWMPMRAPDFYVHTNHYLLWQSMEVILLAPVTISSRTRLTYLNRFRKTSLVPHQLADILSGRFLQDTFSGRESICREGETATLHSQVLKITKNKPSILWTSPEAPGQSRFANWSKVELNF